MSPHFSAVLALAAALSCLGAAAADAQPARKPSVIGRLHLGSAEDPEQRRFLQAFRDGLAALGHREDVSYRLEPRFAGGDAGRLADLARELVALAPDVIVTQGTVAAQVARRTTATIPIVMAMSGPDPVGRGLVASIARPGGNVTGFTGQTEQLPIKQIELLREIVPGLTDLLLIYNGRSGTLPDATIGTASSLGLKVHAVDIAAMPDLERAFQPVRGLAGAGVVVLADPQIVDRNRALITGLALRLGLPSAFSWRMYAEAGGLLSYAEDLADMHRRSAAVVDKVLKGTPPGDIPIEQPNRFELLVNLRTARALGLAVPAAMLARADEVIE